jgi:hypothetical protein
MNFSARKKPLGQDELFFISPLGSDSGIGYILCLKIDNAEDVVVFLGAIKKNFRGI